MDTDDLQFLFARAVVCVSEVDYELGAWRRSLLTWHQKDRVIDLRRKPRSHRIEVFERSVPGSR